MVKRTLLQSQIKDGCESLFMTLLQEQKASFAAYLQGSGVLTFSLFRHQNFLFMYMESTHEQGGFCWEKVFLPFLETWAGEPELRYCVEMNDIFHDNRPIEFTEWRQDYTPDERVGSVAILRPDMYSSYVYYHYQLQEERPASFSKYYIIGSYGRYLFSYEELPAIITSAPPGRLSSDQTPSNWQEVMHPHFEPWPEPNQVLWMKMECLFTV